MKSEQAPEKGVSPFDALMARRNGEPLPEPTCPHFSRDHEGKCWACVYDQRERAMKADAWEECAKESHALGWLHDWALSDLLERNPYRSIPPAKGDA